MQATETLRRSAIAIATLMLLGCQNPATNPGTTPEEEPTGKTLFAGYITDDHGLHTAGHWVDDEWFPYQGNDAYIIDAFEIDGDVYAGGTSYSIGDRSVPCVWKNGVITEMAAPSDADDYYVYSASLIDGKVAIAGTAFYWGGDKLPGYWMDGSWNPLALPAGVTSCYATAVAQENGAIVACGYSGSSVYFWENGAVSTFTAPDGYSRAYPRAIARDGDTTYLVGYVYSSVEDLYAPCTWKNGVPSIMEMPTDPSIIRPYSAMIVDGELVAFGQCYVKSGGDEIQVAGYWKSGAWIQLPIPSGSVGARAYGATPDAKVFSGYATLQGGSIQPGYWETGAWHALSLPSGAASGYSRIPLITETQTPEPARDSGKLAVYTAGAYSSGLPIMNRNGFLMYDQYEADYTTEVESFKASFATSIYLDGNDIFFAGNSTDGGAAYWKNGIRTDLAVPAGTFSRTATDIAVSGSTVYVAGYFKNSTDGETPCLWVNGTMTELEIGGTQGGEANRLAVVGSDVYVSGYYVETDEPGNDNDTWKICFWKNGIRKDLESVTGLPYITAFGLAQSGSDVYLCGSSGIAGEPGMFAPAYWVVSDATPSKTTLEKGGAEKAGLVGLIVEGSSVYATGAFYDAATGWVPAMWKNGLMSALDTDNTQINDFQTGIAVAVDGSDVYVAGMRSYSYEGEVPTLWRNGEIVPLSERNSYGSMMDVAIRRY